MKTESEKLYENKEKKNFFQSEEERNLWIRLNAERIQYGEKITNHRHLDIGSIDKPYSPLWVSNNQLTYDEYMRPEPRFSLEELSAMQHEDLFKLAQERNKQTIKDLFGKFFKINQDDL